MDDDRRTSTAGVPFGTVAEEAGSRPPPALTSPPMATTAGAGRAAGGRAPANRSAAAAGRRPGPLADPDQRRDLLTAASRLLATEGPEALTVRRIATEAGCSTMGVYSRFGGKDGIVEALFVEGFQGLAAAMDAGGETGDPLADLTGCGMGYRRFALAHPTSYSVMFERAVPGYEPSPEAGAIAYGAFDRLVRQVRRAMDAGALVAGDEQEVAQRLWSMTHGWMSLELRGLMKVPPSDEAYFRALLALVGVDGGAGGITPTAAAAAAPARPARARRR